jgi:DNA-3-methyladenine glycosylase II
MGTSVESLRRAGISRQKTGYIHDLCRRILEGSLRLGALEQMEDAAVIEALTEVKGIGRWTAEMFLIFKLHRPDVAQPTTGHRKTSRIDSSCCADRSS